MTDERKLNETLREQARALGLCDEWYGEWTRDAGWQELIDKYLKGIDFCIEHDFPGVDFIRSDCPKGLLEENGIFVDADVNSSTPLPTRVFLGGSRGVLSYDGMRAAKVYVRHRSSVKVTATGGARVFVELWDEGEVSAFADDESRVFVYWHGGEIDASGRVFIRDRRVVNNL